MARPPETFGEELLAPSVRGAPDPVTVYLAGLASGPSRTAQKSALKIIAGLLSPDADPRGLPWHQLRYEHTLAVRQKLTER